MLTLQLSADEILQFAKVLQKEVEKNPNGFINIEIKSYNEITDKNLKQPSFSWSEDLETMLSIKNS